MNEQSLIGECVMRAGRVFVADQIAGGRDPDRPPNRREKMSAMWQSTRLGANVATFVVMWSVALDELGAEELGVEQFIAWSGESSRTLYRRLSDFRSLFPGEETPNAIAAAVLAEARRRGTRPAVDLTLAAA